MNKLDATKLANLGPEWLAGAPPLNILTIVVLHDLPDQRTVEIWWGNLSTPCVYDQPQFVVAAPRLATEDASPDTVILRQLLEPREHVGPALLTVPATPTMSPKDYVNQLVDKAPGSKLRTLTQEHLGRTRTTVNLYYRPLRKEYYTPLRSSVPLALYCNKVVSLDGFHFWGPAWDRWMNLEAGFWHQARGVMTLLAGHNRYSTHFVTVK